MGAVEKNNDNEMGSSLSKKNPDFKEALQYSRGSKQNTSSSSSPGTDGGGEGGTSGNWGGGATEDTEAHGTD